VADQEDIDHIAIFMASPPVHRAYTPRAPPVQTESRFRKRATGP
jgi:hypothetical protein